MEEVVDQVVDSATEVVAGQASKPQLVRLAVVSVVAFSAGGGLAWFVSKRHYQAKYEELAKQEIAEARAFYNRMAKTELVQPESDEERNALTEAGAAAAEALVEYGAEGLKEVAVEVTETVEVDVQPVTSNVFDRTVDADEVWDQDKEDQYRLSLAPGTPYIISHMEMNEGDYSQQTLTYYAEDDVLLDEKEQPINLIDEVVGEDNLTKFGHGVNDNRMVLIRNDRLSLDFEVVKNDGSYARDVLGFQHSDGPRVRKMRRDFE